MAGFDLDTGEPLYGDVVVSSAVSDHLLGASVRWGLPEDRVGGQLTGIPVM
jgi:hypothetical protein